MAAVPLLYNQLRLDSFSWEYNPESLAPTGTLRGVFKAWTTAGPYLFGFVVTTLAPDDDPATVLAAQSHAADVAILADGYTLADDPTTYNL